MYRPHFLLFTFLILLLTMTSDSQTGGENIRITMLKAPKSSDGKSVVVERSAEHQLAILHPSSVTDEKNLVLAAVFEEDIGQDVAFRVKLDNRFTKDWSFIVVEMSKDHSCNSVLPFRKFSETGFTADSEVPVGKVRANGVAEGEWLTEEVGGVQKFAVIASPDPQKLQSIFMSVEFISGLSTGRSEPKVRELEELKLEQSKAKSDGLEEYRVGSRSITITLGSIYSSSGESLHPPDYYDALDLIAGCRYQFHKGSIPLDALRVGWLNNKALANYQIGELAKAKADYEAALGLLTKLTAADQKPRVLERIVTTANLAQVYATLGDQTSAISRYREAEKLANPRPASEVAQQLVSIYAGLGTSLEYNARFDDALGYYRKAEQIVRGNGLASAGIVYNALGRLAAQTGNRVEAGKYFKDAIALSEQVKNPAGVGSASNNLGYFYLQDKRYDEARQAFIRSSEIFADLGNRTAQATALSNLMFVERLQNRPQAAAFFGKRAVKLLQDVRGGLSTLEKQLQRSFLMSREETYRALADTLISLDRLSEAEEVFGLLKEQEYASLSTRRDGPSTEIVPYNDAEEAVQDKIDELSFLRKTRAELQAEREISGADFKKQGELDSVDRSIALINAAVARSLERLATTEPNVSERVKEILTARNLQSTLSKLKKSHNTEAVAIYTVIGTEDIRDAGGKPSQARTKFGWTVLVTPTDRKAYPIDVRGLEETVRRLREALKSDKYDPRPDATKLYTAIFRQTSTKQRATLEDDLAEALARSENKTVMWSLDGVLRYIPMAALYDGTKYLVEKYRNVVFTPQSLIQLQAVNDENWSVLGMGVSEARQGFSPLDGAKDELEFIVRPGMFDGRVILNDKFTKEEAFRLWRDKKYPVIHIASHFKFHSTKPEESFLLVGDGELRVADLKAEDNLFDGVDLLALSACDTAMTSNGKEAESFSYLAQDLGAKTVLASLWPVSDAGTPELMKRFYTLRAGSSSMTKGEAFHRAQMSLLQGETISREKSLTSGPANAKRAESFASGDKKPDLPLYVADKDRPFAHPFYWSPFVLIGNWR